MSASCKPFAWVVSDASEYIKLTYNFVVPVAQGRHAVWDTLNAEGAGIIAHKFVVEFVEVMRDIYHNGSDVAGRPASHFNIFACVKNCPGMWLWDCQAAIASTWDYTAVEVHGLVP